MARNTVFTKARRINWKVVAGEDDLDFYQTYDLVFDTNDLRIRQVTL